MALRPVSIGQLTEAIYDAAIDPAAWADVMAMLRERFSTRVEALYSLDLEKRSMQSVRVGGVTERYYQCFSNRFFTRDNPWTRVPELHRPGVVRTDSILARHLDDAGVLRRSEYYNDWMRPQDLAHTLGTTLLAEGDTIVNLTVLRSADVGDFRDDEVGVFARICGHLQRAIRIAIRLETATTQRSLTLEALECLPYGAVFVDPRGTVLYCNPRAEKLLRNRDGLSVRDGRLVAVDGRDRVKLDGLLRSVAGEPVDGVAGRAHVTCRRDHSDRPLTVSAIPLSAHSSVFIAARPTILVLIMDPASVTPMEIDVLRQGYDLTRAEARLAQALLAGHSVQRAAVELGITYETARWRLKILFQKTGTARQAELVARLLAHTAAPLPPSGATRARPTMS